MKTHLMSDNSWVMMTDEERRTYGELGSIRHLPVSSREAYHKPAQLAAMDAFEKLMNDKYGHGCVAANNK